MAVAVPIAAAAITAGVSYYSSQQQAAAQRKAAAASARAAAAQNSALEEAIQQAYAGSNEPKKASASGSLSRIQEATSQGNSGTLLTGASGVNNSSLPLGQSTLLGS